MSLSDECSWMLRRRGGRLAHVVAAAAATGQGRAHHARLAGGAQGGTRAVQGRYKGSTRAVQGRYRGGTGAVQGRYREVQAGSGAVVLARLASPGRHVRAVQVVQTARQHMQRRQYRRYRQSRQYRRYMKMAQLVWTWHSETGAATRDRGPGHAIGRCCRACACLACALGQDVLKKSRELEEEEARTMRHEVRWEDGLRLQAAVIFWDMGRGRG